MMIQITPPQVTCFSCGLVLKSNDCINPSFFDLHSTSCKRNLSPKTEAAQLPVLSLSQLPMGVIQVIITLRSFFSFYQGVSAYGNCSPLPRQLREQGSKPLHLPHCQHCHRHLHHPHGQSFRPLHCKHS